MPDEDLPEVSSDDARVGDGPVTGQRGVAPIRLTGGLALSDFYHARRLATRSYWPRAFVAIGVSVAFIILFAAIALSVQSYSPEAANRILATVVLVYPLLIALPLALFRLNAWRLWRRKAGVFSVVESTITEEGITIQAVEQGISSHCSWNAFTGFRLSDRLAVLYLRAGNYIVVPRAKFAREQEWRVFLRLVEEKLARV